MPNDGLASAATNTGGVSTFNNTKIADNSARINKRNMSVNNKVLKRDFFADMNKDGNIDPVVEKVLSACGSADEAQLLKQQVFPDWHCKCCNCPTCNGNMQMNEGLREFVFVQNPRVADPRKNDASSLVAGLKTNIA